MTTIVNGLKAEYIKSRGTKLLWITLAIPSLITLFAFLIMKNINIKAGLNGWDRLTSSTISLLGFNILMMSLISIISLSVQTEHKANAWKHLLTLPIPKWTVFVSKYIFVLLLIASAHILTVVFLLLNGYLLSYLRPELNFSVFRPDLYVIMGSFSKIFLSTLCVTAIQYCFSTIPKMRQMWQS